MSIRQALHTKYLIQNTNYQKGFTVVEIVVSVGILLMMAMIIAQIYVLIVSQIVAYREQTTITALADQYMEVARNLPYSQLGTISGNPHGALADSANPIATNVNNVPYQIYYEVTYVDDSADGTIILGTDAAPNDYKQIKLSIKNTRTNFVNSFFTSIVPKGLEGLASGGALMIKVFDAVGQPVPGASVRIQNTTLNPTIDLTRTSDSSGNWVEVGLPNSANSYHITVTKNGYSSDQTYPTSVQNPNPVKPDSSVLNGQVTQVSFSIDVVSNLTFTAQDQICAPISGVDIAVQGAKLIGLPAVLKFNNTYTSNGSGQVPLTGVEWDTYTPALISNSYMIYGTSPIQQINVLPNTTQNFNVMLGAKTANSFLVIVKDAATQNPIELANVNLQSTNPAFDSSKLTEGSVWSQQDWSEGSGQANFSNVKKYFSDDGNVDGTVMPLALRLLYFNNAYISAGQLTSSSFDTGTNLTAYTSLEWQPTSQDVAATVKFQLAANNDNTTWDYLGPDGTANTYYTTSGTSISPSLNGKRYVRYKAFLSTTDNTKTPVVTSVNVNYVSGCPAPGQAMFAGLTSGSDYKVVVSASGYQTQTIDNITISGYNVLTVLLTP